MEPKYNIYIIRGYKFVGTAFIEADVSDQEETILKAINKSYKLFKSREYRIRVNEDLSGADELQIDQIGFANEIPKLKSEYPGIFSPKTVDDKTVYLRISRWTKS